MKRRIPVPILISVLLTLVLTACAGAAEVKLAASDGAADDYFGYSVSISGDYAIVGAYYDDDSASNSGSAYIFKRDGTAWSEQAKITASDGAANDRFGGSVSISGDYAIVSACRDDDGGSSSGSAYIFKRDGTSWGEQAKITASDGAADDMFGRSVSISGDYAIVGALYDDDSGSNSGSAYIFKRDGTSWNEQAKITASDGAADDLFGYPVSMSGDYAIVGAYYDDDSGSSSGSAYIFKRDGTSWSEQAKITASDGAAGDLFGISASISGDYAIVGAYRDDDNGSDSGSAYFFKRDGTSWSEQAKITASDGAAGDLFGASVSISGDYATVSAHCDDDRGSDSGSAYIFKRDGTAWGEQAKITASDGAAGDLFGGSVSISGDYAIVSAYRDDDGGSDSGSAYVYDILTQPTLDPTNLANTTGNFWVNHTWQAGSGNVTDSYNVSVNGVWHNTTADTFRNDTCTAHAWQNITVYAWNSSTGTLSTGSVSQNTQIPNNPVTITNTSDWSGDAGEAVYVDYDATDADSDTSTFSCNRTDLFTDFSTATGQGNWTATSGTYYVDFGVSDGWGSTSNYTMTIMVNGTAPPVIHSVLLDPVVVTPNGSIIVTVTATDDSGIASVTADGIALALVANDTYEGAITASDAPGTYNVTVVATDNSTNGNNVTDDSATYTVTESVPPVTLYIEDVAIRQGENITVPITVFDVADMGGCEIEFTYNPAVVYVIDVARGDLNFSFEYNINNGSGWMRANALDVYGQSGDVVFAYVTLAAVGNKSDVSEMEFEYSRLLDASFGEIAHTRDNGTFSILPNVLPEVTNVSATPDTILYDNGRRRTPGTNSSLLSAYVTDADGDITAVTIDLSSIGGSPAQPMEPVSEGVWEVTITATEVDINAPDFTHQLAITATDDNGGINDSVSIELTVLKRGDVNGDGLVDKADADYISRYLAGLEPEASNPPGVLVGDVIGDAGGPVGNGVVDLMDALYIAKYTSGMVEEP